MRALRVVGITEDGSVVLEDPGRRERFTVPADEQLRAAARGDLTRLGQIAIELESQLRPREIQARIRAGASVEQVASAAGVPAQKIERFAYPVLLERTRTAEIARAAHPVRSDGPDVRTLGDTVAHTFGLRGQDHTEADWDSWKGEDGKWVVALSWRAGRSDIRAHWTFQPGAHGGTVTALDEHATDLVEGLPQRPLRTVGPVIDIARSEDDSPDQGRRSSEEVRAEMVRAASGMGVRAPLSGGETRSRSVAPEQRRPPSPRRPDQAPAEPAPRDEPAPAAEAREETTGTPAWNRATPGTGSDTTGSTITGSDTPGSGPTDEARPSAGRPAPDVPAPDTATSDDTAPDTTAPVTAASDVPASDVPASAPAVSPGRAPAVPAAASTATSPVAPAATAPAATAPEGRTAGAAPLTGESGFVGAPSGSVPPAAATPAARENKPAAPDRATASEQPAAPEKAGADEPAPVETAGREKPAAEEPAAEKSADEKPVSEKAAENPVQGKPAEPAPAAEKPVSDKPVSDKPAAGKPASEKPVPEKPAEPAPAAEQAPPAAPKRTRKGKPVMPSWDEVLLGVRGQR
ncbi:MAG: septation protein SepH [Pseudonocardia sp.]|nr:septation protein SepH [Pseudonocardia sp.]